MNNYTKYIPPFLVNTELESLIKSDIEFKKSLVMSLEDSKSEFSVISKHRGILILFLKLVDVIPYPGDTTDDLKNKLEAVLYALQNPGTYISITKLCYAFLGVKDIEFVDYEQVIGKLKIKLLSRPRFRKKILIKSSATNKAFLVTHKGKKYALLLNKSEQEHVSNFKVFLKYFVLAGVEVELISPDAKKDTEDKETIKLIKIKEGVYKWKKK